MIKGKRIKLNVEPKLKHGKKSIRKHDLVLKNRKKN